MSSRLTTHQSTKAITIAVGTAVTVYVVRKVWSFPIFTRWIQWIDPIQPDGEQIAAYTRGEIPIGQVEYHIREKPNAVLVGAEQRIVWNGGGDGKSGRRHRTKTAVVFLHGWGACRQELAPLPERLASALEANLYEGRLPGHGRKHERGVLGGGGPSGDTMMTEATPQELFLYALKAFRIGVSIGDQVVLMGMSTGAALLTWLASRLPPEHQQRLAGLVFVSPAYALGHPLYPVLKNTFASLRLVPFLGHALRSILIELVLGGKTRNLKVISEAHFRYNSLIYPTRAVLNLLDVLWECSAAHAAESYNYATIDVPTVMIGNPQDTVIDFRMEATNVFLQRLGEVPKALYCVTPSTEHGHVIGSEMLSPSSVEEVAHVIVHFMTAHILGRGDGAQWRGQRDVDHEARVSLKSRSVPYGLGSFASLPSFGDLTRDFEF